MVKVSVIIPIYGVEKYIEKCARSIFEQTYPNLEIIFVDDCTPDHSILILKHILEEYPQMKDKTQILSYFKNRGVAGARQAGLDVADGEYIIQFDPDDYIERDMIELLVTKANEEEADIVICDFNMIQNGTHTHVHVNPSLIPIKCVEQVLTGEMHGSLCNKLIRKSLYVENQITFIQGLNMMEDLSVMYRLMYFAKKIAYIPQAYYNYVLREGSISSYKMNSMQQKNSQELIALVSQFYIQHNIQDQGLKKALVYFKIQIKTGILLFGDLHEVNHSLYKDIDWVDCVKHPTINIYRKVIGVLDSCHFIFCIRICRQIIQRLQKKS